MRKTLLYLICCFGMVHATDTLAASCIVGGSDFETSETLLDPILSNDADGWFSKDLDKKLDKQCGSSCNYYLGAGSAKLMGTSSAEITSSAGLSAKWSSYTTKTITNTSVGFAGIMANPRIISPYLNEGSGSNQYVFYGNGQNVSVLSYTVSGLVANSTVTLEVDVYNLVSSANLEKALQIKNKGVTDPDELVDEIVLGRKLSFTMLSEDGTLTPGSGSFSASAPQLSVSTSMQTGFMASGDKKTTKGLGWGESQKLTLTTTADNSGTVTFYFAGSNSDFGALALDNLRIEGEIDPVIRVVGNPCPQMSTVVKLNTEFPTGSKYSWKEKSTGETSSDQSMIFFPPSTGDYSFTCSVTTPEGCVSTATHNLTVGECCDDGNGKLMALTDIYLDDFGRFSGNTYYYRDKKGQEQTVKATEILVGNGNHGYCIEDQLNRGAAFAEEMKFSGRNFRNGAYAIATENAYNNPSTMFDASGEKGGAFLQIDMKGDGWLDKVVYEQEITGLCPERSISFSAAVGAINKKPTSGYETNATIQVRLVNSATNEVIMAGGSPIEDTYVLDKVGWVEPKKTYDFKLPKGVESVKIQIISKEDDYEKAQRGDIALDDITFRVCTPPSVEVVASSNSNDLLNLCMGDDLVLKAEVKAIGYFEDPIPGYLFQYTLKDPSDPSFDPVVDWVDLGEVQEDDKYTIKDPATHPAFANVDSREKVRFRVVIGEFNYLKNQRSLWESLDELSPCRNVSFSTIPVEAALNCDICEPVKKASIISADQSTLISINAMQEKEVILCPGNVANLSTETFAPTDPTVMGISEGPSDQPRKYIASWHKGSKSARGVSGAGTAPGDPSSFYNVTWEDSDWYYLLVKDIEFPDEDGKICWRWDSIHVIGGVKPTEKLTEPDVFCEGTLKTEPTKTIEGFKIDWYDGADTVRANAISVPVVGDVTKAESPKSFWYVLNDEKTGCRGESNEYVVDVQRVDEPSASPITYLKTEVEKGNVLKPTEQSPDAIVGDASCTIVWYNDDKSGPIKEEDATPVPSEVVGLTGNLTKEYKIKQVNALGCESDFVPVSITVSGYPAPTVNNLSVCQNSPLLKDTLVATTNGVNGGNAASEFKLVWYNSKDDGTIDDSQEFDKIELSPANQQASATGKEKKYTYYVRQRLKSNPAAESAPVAVTVTVYTNPKLTAVTTAPKCLGEVQDLKEMFNINIDNCEVSLYENGSFASVSKDVTKSGVYLVKGSYVINAGEADEQTCSSDEEELNVVFHELNADILGLDKTCPNVAVDLDLDLTLGGGLTEDELFYTWSNNLNNKTAKTKTYNTGSAGLNNAGDKMQVSVEVSSAACNGARAVKKVKEIVVGDGRLVGNIRMSEMDNTSVLSDVISSNNLSFNSCGGMVTVELSDVANVNGGSYKLAGTTSDSGTFSDEAAGSTTLNLGEGSYTVSYVNECPTKFSFKIVDMSAKANSRNGELTICENNKWWAEIVNLDGPSNTVIEWQHNGVVIPGQTETRLTLDSAKPSDSGSYSFSLLSEGCRFDSKVAGGDELTVKPYVKFDCSSFKDYYEVINGDPLEIKLGFTEPSNSAEIEDGVKWYGVSNQKGTTLNIPSVGTDYEINVVAVNRQYCQADTDIVVRVDAKLQLYAALDETSMCEGEKHKLIIDTAGTGYVLHPENIAIKATETIGTNVTVLTLKPKDDKFVAEISPRSDAVYDVIYTYATENRTQSVSTSLKMQVSELFKVQFSPASPVCGDGIASTSVTVTTNSSVEELDWSENPEGEVSANMTEVTYTPIYTASGIAPQYKVYKVIARNQVCSPTAFYDTVEVHKPLEGSIESALKICEFERLTLDASSYQADTYQWLYNETEEMLHGATPSLVPQPDVATFTLNITRGQCKAEDYKSVEIVYVPEVESVDSISYNTIQIMLKDNGSVGPYSYIIDGKESSIYVAESLRENISYGAHTLKVVDPFGCSTETKFVVNYPEIEIPIIVSPDDNGINDRFVVKGLAEGYPDADVTIFDRWGKQLAKYKAGDGTDWDGVYNGFAMPSTDYWYEIDIKSIEKTYTGHFTLIRQ